MTWAGATAAVLGGAATAANDGARPLLPNFYLGHGISVNAAEMPMIGTDLGEEFDEKFILQSEMVPVFAHLPRRDLTVSY
ncbi:peptidase, M24 family protein [Mycobacterium haemophilum DSM 44634]|nr:hypothetical protein B586_05690 [Mycobacterium haemophilum DSM 44634]